MHVHLNCKLNYTFGRPAASSVAHFILLYSFLFFTFIRHLESIKCIIYDLAIRYCYEAAVLVYKYLKNCKRFTNR